MYGGRYITLTPFPHTVGSVNRITVTERIKAAFLVKGVSGALLSILEGEPC